MTASSPAFRTGRAAPLAAAILAAFATLTGCSLSEGNEMPPTCPSVTIDREATRATEFRHGLGRDATDIVMETDLLGFTSDCSWDRKNRQITMHLSPSFQSHLGPAAAEGDDAGIRHANFKYLVMLPEFFPHPAARQIFVVNLAFPTNRDEVTYQDKQINLLLPLSGGMTPEDLHVVLSMHLDGGLPTHAHSG